MPRPTLAWIASYPKSGNTWMRLFLANYLVGGSEPLPINQVHRLVMFDAAVELYRSAGLPAFDHIADDSSARRLRPRMLKWVAGRADLTFAKTHFPRHPIAGRSAIPPALTRAAVYILRDPRDVAISYARHFSTTPDRAAAALGRSATKILPSPRSVTQPIGTWSAHVAGWTDPAARPAALAVRYEDMLADPEATFTRVLAHLGLPLEADRLARAIRFASFDELRKQEERDGFHEQPGLRQAFFHTGAAGQWRDRLSTEAARRIETEHAAQMTRFGYLPGAG